MGQLGISTINVDKVESCSAIKDKIEKSCEKSEKYIRRGEETPHTIRELTNLLFHLGKGSSCFDKEVVGELRGNIFSSLVYIAEDRRNMAYEQIVRGKDTLEKKLLITIIE